MAPVSNTGSGNTDGGSNPSPSAMYAGRVVQAEISLVTGSGYGQMLCYADVVIVNGKVVKNRYGKCCTIGGAFFVWDERDEV